MSMLKELAEMGITPAYTNKDYVLDCYNQFIIRPLSWYAKEDFVRIVKANKELEHQYFWRAK